MSEYHSLFVLSSHFFAYFEKNMSTGETMSNKRTLLVGTFVLTTTGFLSRLIGFFFRMFLSHSFGEEQVGLYQLIFPLYALCFSLSAAGMETAIARSTARKISLGKKKEAIQILYIGLGISLALSFCMLLLMQNYASALSIYILGDIRCEPMLLAISYAIPFAAVHSCICGYYFGLKQTKIPALSQLVEQLVRVASVYILYTIACKQESRASILFAVFGIVIGECCSAFFCVHCFTRKEKKSRFSSMAKNLPALSKELLAMSIPLTCSRILLNILQSVESISIPLRLQQYGLDTSQALSNYGVLTGMALPCILFPSALTNSVSTMLLPTVAEIQAGQNTAKLKQVLQRVFYACFGLGLTCLLIFVCLGGLIGKLLFHSELAGDYLRTLGWICPFLYVNSTLGSITNGLGKANITFSVNTTALSIRIIGVLVCIPRIGMNGYLWGLLLSQILTCVFYVLYLRNYLTKRRIAKPTLE